MKVLYFAWIKVRVGLGEEDITPPAEITTVGALIDWLKHRSAGHQSAFEDLAAVRVAVNQDFAAFDAPITPNDEVAFFPPVTGG